jgi:hypothetical protein
MLHLPSGIAPASTKRCVTVALYGATYPFKILLEQVSFFPFTEILSFYH